MKTSSAVLARWSSLLILALTLSSCGGGGGSSTPTCPNDCPYTVGGTVTGLATGNSVVLLNNGGDPTTVSANTTFTFATALAPFTQYAVTVGTQPAGQTCTVADGSGTSSGTTDVTNVSVTCAANADYTVSVTVTGLTGQGLVLELNGSQDQMVAADGTVTFPSGLMTGASYAVTVKTQPTTRREICGVSNGSGTIAPANVTNVAVNCSIVLGFLYQTVNQTASSYQLLSYGISAGTGSLVPFGTQLVTDSPSPGGAMVASPGGGFLILSSETNANATDGSISVYAVNSDTGALTAVSSIVTTLFRPIYLVMSPQGFLFVLGAGAPGFPPGTPGYKSVLAAYLFDASAGTLTSTGTPLTVSAVNFAVRPDGRFLYVLNVDFNSNTPVPATLTAYAIDGTTGALTAGPVLTWMTSQNNGISTGSGGMAIDALGRFLYLASEQGDSLQAAATVLPYAIDPNSGALTPIGTGTPVVSGAGGMTVDPSGRYLYVLNSLNSNAANDTVLAMAIDQSSGVVSPLGSPLQTGSPPSTIICDPSGQFVYAGTGGSNFFDPTATDILPFAISTVPSTAGQLVPSGQSGSSAQTIAVAIVE